MKHPSFAFLITFSLLLAACSEQKHTHEHAHDHETESSGNAQVDSLKKTVMAVHDSVMPKMDAIMSLRMKTQQQLKQLDSLEKTTPQQANPQRQELSTLLTELDNADEAMMQWMQQFDGQMKNKTDEQKMAYLKNEKVRIDSVQTLMLHSIAKGQQLLQVKEQKR